MAEDFIASARPLPGTTLPLARYWREAFARLSAIKPPCLGIRVNEWPQMHAVARRFLAEHADRAVELGWTTELIFGVDPGFGAMRADACGALMYSTTTPVVSVERYWISFGDTRYHRTPGRAAMVPVWDWKEPKRTPEGKPW